MEDFLYAYNQPKQFGKYDFFLDGKITVNELVYKIITEEGEYQNIDVAEKVKEIEGRLQTHFTFEHVSELPTEGKATVIYLVPNADTSDDPDTKDKYDEYMWVKKEGEEKGKFELIGSGSYAQQKAELDKEIADRIADVDAEEDRAIAREDDIVKKLTTITGYDFSEDLTIEGGNIDTRITTLNTKIEAETKRATEKEATIDAELAKRVPYTLYRDVNVVGNTKDVVKLDVPDSDKEAMYCPQGLIMGGTALSAGLVTRGICGIDMSNNNTTNDGSCTKDNLYINYDGTNTNYNPYRQVIIQADNSGEHYGHNLYQYAAARGDAVKGYVDEKIGKETSDREALQEEVTALKSQVNMLEIRIDFLEGQNISEKIETNNIEEALVDTFTQAITLNNVVISTPQNLALNKENDVNVSIGSITIDGMTYGNVQTIAEGDSFLATDTGKIFIDKLGQIGEKDADGNITKNVIKCKVNVRGNDADGKNVNVISGVVSIMLNGDYKNVETSLHSYLSVLPDGYRRCEYLESTGTQWIDTGIKLSNESEVKCEFQIPDDSAIQYIFGSKTSYLVDDFSLCFNVYNNGSKHINPMVGNEYVVFPYESGKTYSIAITTSDVICNNQTKNINNSEIFETPNTCAIFGLRWAGDISRIYSFSISRNDQLQVNLIPCLDDTGTPCMYDTVNRKPLYNQGTGKFLTNRTLPDGYTELEYLESTGTQYIDTGIKLSSESEVRVTLYAEEIDDQTSQSPYGCSGDSSKQFYCYSKYYYAPSQFYISVFYLPKNFITSQVRVVGKCDIIHNAEGFTVNGITTPRSNEFDPFETTTNCFVFAASQGVRFIGHVYSFSIRKNGVLQADYQPCLDDQGKPCMYDFVSKQPKYNDNQKETSDFLYVLPETGTFALRQQDLTSMGSLSKYGLRRIHRLPFNFDGDMDKFIAENNIKPIVETEMPNDGKTYAPNWTQTEEEIILEWIEVEPTIEEITN